VGEGRRREIERDLTMPPWDILITVGSIINTNTTKEKYMSLPAGDIGNYPIVNEVLLISGAGVGTGSLFNVKLYYR